MLVLGRKPRQKVMLTLPSRETIVVCVLEVDHQWVRLGFDAPADVVVDREEIYNSKLRDAASRPAKGPELN